MAMIPSALTPQKDLLVGRRNDTLIPTQDAIHLTWEEAKATWASHLKQDNEWPIGFFNPLILLNAIPAFPETAPDRLMVGRAEWWIRHPLGGHEVVRTPKGFNTIVDLPWSVSFQFCDGSVSASGPRSLQGLSILTLCWSYILSASLFDRQGTKVVYTNTYIQPQTTTASQNPPTCAISFPARASTRLIRWICALLATEVGWKADQQDGYSPWAMLCSTDSQVLLTESRAFDSMAAPDVAEAMILLQELCTLFQLHLQSNDNQGVPVYTAAFLAALSVPYFRLEDMKAVLPSLTLSAPSDDHEPIGRIPSEPCSEIFKHLSYFMSLGMSPLSYQSIFWSVFWQPGIPCNLVSPWLSGIGSVIKPLLDSGDVLGLVRLFASRRPRAALLSLGILLLGGPRLLDTIRFRLRGFDDTGDERFDTEPDMCTTVWTGAPLSFWDYELDSFGNYRGPQMVCAAQKEKSLRLPKGYHHRSELLQRRANGRIKRPNDEILCGWEPPLNPISEADIPNMNLEEGYFRRYSYFKWSRCKTKDRGFRHAHGTYMSPALKDDFTLLAPALLPTNTDPERRIIYKAASRWHTVDTVYNCLRSHDGQAISDTAAWPGFDRSHDWMKGW